MKIDVIIPLYKPNEELFELLERLNKQSVPIQNIILMNTEEKYFEKLIYNHPLQEKHSNVKVHHLSKREFDHGKTRHTGIKKSDADVVVLMTQDALPADQHLIEHLIAHLEDKVAVAYARQLPKKDCNEIEKITRAFNYKTESRIKTAADLQELGIKTYFCSNVCAAYRRDVYEELGGFIRHTIFNEDMIYAANAVKAGYAIAYEANAQVYHSHNYTCKQQFKRNFDLGVSQAEHPEIFANVPSEAEGSKMVKMVMAQLKAQGMWKEIFYFIFQCMSKYAGYLLGKHYRKLPKKIIFACTDNKEYWK